MAGRKAYNKRIYDEDVYDWRVHDERVYDKRKRNLARRRKRRIIKLVRMTLAGGVIIAAVFSVKKVLGDRIMLTENGIVWDTGELSVIEQSGDASDTLRELLENNPETADFIKNYPDMKDNPPAESVGDMTKGVIPHLLQWDERWGYQTYGDNMIAVNGCGPTALSMVAAGLTGDNTITPYKVAGFAAEQGYYAGESGTSWSLMTEGAQQFGIRGEELGLSREEVFSALENGQPIICSMRPGDFTTTGHFIVLVGTKDGKIRVNDPNSLKRSEKLWDYETLEYQINNLWGYTVL